MLSRLLQNHVLANLTFVLVLIVGLISYQQLPRQQDPTINFNWISISLCILVLAPVMSKKGVTDVIEDTINGIPDIRFVSSDSRESVSSILVRFEDLPEKIFN